MTFLKGKNSSYMPLDKVVRIGKSIITNDTIIESGKSAIFTDLSPEEVVDRLAASKINYIIDLNV